MVEALTDAAIGCTSPYCTSFKRFNLEQGHEPPPGCPLLLEAIKEANLPLVSKRHYAYRNLQAARASNCAAIAVDPVAYQSKLETNLGLSPGALSAPSTESPSAEK